MHTHTHTHAHTHAHVHHTHTHSHTHAHTHTHSHTHTHTHTLTHSHTHTLTHTCTHTLTHLRGKVNQWEGSIAHDRDAITERRGGAHGPAGPAVWRKGCRRGTVVTGGDMVAACRMYSDGYCIF